jgi:hypothetical protein
MPSRRRRRAIAATQAWGLQKPETRLPLVALGRLVDASRPRHMPVEALDLGAGYQLAAAAIRGLTRRLTTGQGSVSQLSLARTAAILTDEGQVPEQQLVITLPVDGPSTPAPSARSGGCASPCISSETRSFGSIPRRPRARPTPVWVTAQ